MSDSLQPPWTAARPASLSFTISWSFLKLISIELVMPSNRLILYHPLLLLPSVFPSIRVFSSESALTSGGQSIGASASVLVLPVNIQGWFPLGLTGLISLLSKGLSRVFSSSAIWEKVTEDITEITIWCYEHECHAKSVSYMVFTAEDRFISM